MKKRTWLITGVCSGVGQVFHSAAKGGWFAHIAIEVPTGNGSVEWFEAVNDEQYNELK